VSVSEKRNPPYQLTVCSKFRPQQALAESEAFQGRSVADKRAL
jgi:hypothetical protein